MRELAFRDAVCEAMRQEMSRDPRVFLMGLDVGAHGGSLKTDRGLIQQFGARRVVEMPVCEQTMVGMGIGAALMGFRPVVEVLYIDILMLAVDQIVNHASKMRYLTGGEAGASMVIRTATGAGSGNGVHHGQSLESLFTHAPGLKVVFPVTPYEAKGMLIAAIRDPDPVLVLEHKRLYATKGPVPEGEYTLPLDRAEVKREGEDVTVVAYGIMVPAALTAAEEMAKKGASVEVVDLHSLYPLDADTILSSVRKTGRVVIAQEPWKTGGIGAEVAALVGERALGYLDAPIQRVAAPDTHIPFSHRLEEIYLPNCSGIIRAVESALAVV